MNSIIQANNTEPEVIDFLQLITLICHLMTQYALHPCAAMATNINRHFQFLLNSSAAESLGEWQGTFQQLFIQWQDISARHMQHHLKTAKIEAQQATTH